MKEIIPIVQKIEDSRPSFRFERKKAEPQPKFKTTHALTRWLSERVQNKPHYSGRINYGGLEHSRGAAHTVCPYVPHFLDNIEEGIKPVVVALFNKGYLTYSSCAGHEYEPRYVGMALKTDDAREQLVALLGKRFWLWIALRQFSLRLLISVVNSKIKLDGTKFLDIETGGGQSGDATEVDYFNTLFYRRYTSWVFLRITIGYEVVFTEQPGLSRWKRVELWFARLTFRYVRGRLTRKLAEFVASKEFPPYLED